MLRNSNIDIKVDTDYIYEQSEPEENRYVFSYTITIVNHGKMPAQLMSRQWIITDSNGKIQEVRGDGVVGKQPKLNPGEQFRYSSGTVIETPVGAMEGKYCMMEDNGNNFEALIPPFTLAVPGILH
ncbi:MAG: Co2+/Mg2+ efflux protein ApaG [Pseudomonadota bacterium]|nr:Co2+/Mg2+ efflux protein ApaG [Pseudomonadota bacterium]